MDINKIAKTMTREEFLNSEYVIDKDEEDEEKDLIYYKCPNNYGLKESDCYCICGECWENAIKDIKFKGDVNMEFDWGNFKYNFIAVHCNTEYELNDFFKRCEENNIKISRERKFNAKLCYEIIDTDILIGGNIEYYKNQDYDIIEWEMESPFIENKIDYDREYNIMEIMEFEEDMEFIDNMRLKVRFKNGCMEVWSNTKLKWVECKITKNWLNSKFKLIKKDKKVSFKEAIQAYGKEIYCLWKTSYNTATKSCYKIGKKESLIIDKEGTAISPNEILNGEWYIKED